MYAIIQDSGQQFKVSEGDVVRIDLLGEEMLAEPLEFVDVLLVADGDNVKVGTPYVPGAKVLAEVRKPMVKGEKLRVLKYKRRKGARRRAGHRQKYTELRITKIIG